MEIKWDVMWWLVLLGDVEPTIIAKSPVESREKGGERSKKGEKEKKYYIYIYIYIYIFIFVFIKVCLY